ncbi:hypothetical protein R3P38DRAFT_2809258 [Favolaschia claudopus]|uniref:Uncharacterized protein n=1 Tax=Favolaschia claudopus TaxID=2862362 RepID=A0AAV9ZEC0_9AGAR
MPATARKGKKKSAKSASGEEEYRCTCEVKCHGGKKVSRATYNRHSKYRHQLRTSLGDSSDSGQSDYSDSDRESTDSSSEPPAKKIKLEWDLYSDGVVDADEAESDESDLEDTMDPGSVDDLRNNTHPFPNPDDTESDSESEDDDISTWKTTVDDLKTSLEFISAVKDASLDNGDLDSDTLARLRDPPTHSIEINNADLRFTLDIFLATTHASEEVFNAVRQASLPRNETDYKERRKETGIVKPSIFSGLPRRHRLGVPGCFPGDIMH